jgi:hypothetical protein
MIESIKIFLPIYATADSTQKRMALEKATENAMTVELGDASWEKDENLKSFLKGLA